MLLSVQGIGGPRPQREFLGIRAWIRSVRPEPSSLRRGNLPGPKRWPDSRLGTKRPIERRETCRVSVRLRSSGPPLRIPDIAIIRAVPKMGLIPSTYGRIILRRIKPSQKRALKCRGHCIFRICGKFFPSQTSEGEGDSDLPPVPSTRPCVYKHLTASRADLQSSALRATGRLIAFIFMVLSSSQWR